MPLFKCRQLTFQQIDSLCQDLAHEVVAFEPECIVSIDTGGRYVGEKLSLILNVPHSSMYICRSIYEIPFIEKLPLIMGLLVRGILFRFTKPVLQKGFNTVDRNFIQNKRVLLVDDAVVSGRTLEVGMKVLQGEIVRTAVLVNNSGSKVDYEVLNGSHLFPWSRTSPEYKKFLNYLKTART